MWSASGACSACSGRGQPGTGFGIELAAVLMLGAIAAMYVVAVLAVAGEQAVVASSFVGAVAVGSWLRAAEIVRALRLLIRTPEIGDIPLRVRRESSSRRPVAVLGAATDLRAPGYSRDASGDGVPPTPLPIAGC